MDKTITYIKLLQDSLQKKKKILLHLTQLTKEQTVLFNQKEKNTQRHEEVFDEKQQLIDELNRVDDGFEAIYKNISTILKSNKSLYETEIKTLQVLISEITDLGVNLQALEMKNKEKFNLFLKNQKEEIRHIREGSRMSGKYYQNMANQHQIGQTYFLDEKK